MRGLEPCFLCTPTPCLHRTHDMWGEQKRHVKLPDGLPGSTPRLVMCLLLDSSCHPPLPPGLPSVDAAVVRGISAPPCVSDTPREGQKRNQLMQKAKTALLPPPEGTSSAVCKAASGAHLRFTRASAVKASLSSCLAFFFGGRPFISAGQGRQRLPDRHEPQPRQLPSC